MESSEIIRQKKYSISITDKKDGTTNMERINDGFNAIELIGILDFAKDEIIKQIKGDIKPDIIKRQVVID